MATTLFRCCACIALLGLSACGMQPIEEGGPADTKPFAKFTNTATPSREKLALSYAEQGRYADALVQWKILYTLHPGNTHYETRIRQTEDRIDGLATQHQRAGIAALGKADYPVARHELLAALALDPTRIDLLNYLRRIEYERLWNIQSAKLEKLKISEDRKATNAGEQERSYFELGSLMFREGEYNGAIREIQKYLNSYPSDTQAKKLISDAYAKLAAQQRQQGLLRNALDNVEQAKRFNNDNVPTNNKAEQELRYALADEYYEKGVRAQRNDLKLAIEMFNKALEYNPLHAKARTKLADALRMQKRLDEIGK
ncbi:MAG: tetratricopeptide repeat protein [Gammaproteobacteria bacterium]|nr:tetratricopeptide repeat protein [Gammaproteobacteria bacterium]